MVLSIRINGSLAQEIGTTRLTVDLPSPVTVENVIQELVLRHPHSAETLQVTIPFVGGRHLDKTTILKQGQQIALLMPAAGG
ncbi:MAG: MoaD/ThiS family protein [Anaerolineae bacterium]